MNLQIGDLVLYFHIPDSKRHYCLVTKIEKLPDGSTNGFVCVEWLTEYAQKTYTRYLSPSALRNDRNGYWRKNDDRNGYWREIS